MNDTGARAGSSALLLINAEQIATCAGEGRARRGSEMRDAAVLTPGGRGGAEGTGESGDTGGRGRRPGSGPRLAVAIEGEQFAAVGEQNAIERAYPGARRVDCRGCFITPGLVDSHTHSVFGAPRFEEQELRASGTGYMEIARQGGGIHASVRDVRGRGESELYDIARSRLARLAAHGTTTVEVKSGYGLSVDDEVKMLSVVARLAKETPLRVVPTWLGAHEIPLEFREGASSRAGYVELLIHHMLPEIARLSLARFADVFCEPGVFTIREARTILSAARDAGLRLKLHADELENSGGAELAASLGATSADHLAAISSAGIRALAAAPVVATLLPGTMLFLGRERQAPARALIDAGAAVAIASDFNPGTSPTVNFPLILTLAVSQLHLSAAEALIAATVNGAAALDLARSVGQIAPGYSADLAVFEGTDYRELPYWYGDRRCRGSWTRGKPCYPCELPIL